MRHSIKKYIVTSVISIMAVVSFFTFQNSITGKVVDIQDADVGWPNFFLLFILASLLIAILQSETLETKLSKELTGMDYKNPQITERIIADQKKVRTRYGLPDSSLIESNPLEYEKKIMEVARVNGLKIEKSDKVPSGIRAMHDSGKILLSNSKKYEDKSPSYLNAVTHEVVHGIQEKKNPSMSIEEREYEAYLVSGTDDPNKLGKVKTRRGLFSLIGFSVNWAKHHYGEK